MDFNFWLFVGIALAAWGAWNMYGMMVEVIRGKIVNSLTVLVLGAVPFSGGIVILVGVL